MLKGRTLKTIFALAAAALIAAIATVTIPGMSEPVEAHTPTVGAKGDRLDMRAPGPDCSQRGWPYLETACLRDRNQNAGRALSVRVVGLDRLN